MVAKFWACAEIAATKPQSTNIRIIGHKPTTVPRVVRNGCKQDERA
jgi:hypothetical protein